MWFAKQGSPFTILEPNREVLKIILALYLTDFAISHDSPYLQPGNRLLGSQQMEQYSMEPYIALRVE